MTDVEVSKAVEKVTVAIQDGCGDHGCLFVKPKGQGTDRRCSCFDRPMVKQRLARLYKAALAATTPSDAALAVELG